MRLSTRKLSDKDDQEGTYWLSVSDLMTCLLLLFVLVVAYTVYKKNNEKSDNEVKLSSLKEKEKKHKSIIKQRDKKIGRLQRDYKDLEIKYTGIDKYNNRIERENAKFLKQLQEVDPKENIIEKEGSASWSLKGESLFDKGESEMKENGKKKFLKRFLKYYKQKEIWKDIDRIMVLGHTDRSYKPKDYDVSHLSLLFNLDLSNKRAFMVVEFLYETFEKKDPEFLKKNGCKFFSIGRSFFDYDEGQEDAWNRRVEIQFVRGKRLCS